MKKIYLWCFSTATHGASEPNSPTVTSCSRSSPPLFTGHTSSTLHSHCTAFHGDVCGKRAQPRLDHHGRSVSLVLQRIQTRGVAGEGDPDDEHGEMHRIKPSSCRSAVAQGAAGGAAAVLSGAEGAGGTECEWACASVHAICVCRFPHALGDGGNTSR